MAPRFKNVVPVDGEFEVLDLLIGSQVFAYALGEYKHLWTHDRDKPYVSIESYDARGEFVSTDYYAVTPGVVRRLIERRLIENSPRYGGFDRHKFQPSLAGAAYWNRIKNDAARICHE